MLYPVNEPRRQAGLEQLSLPLAGLPPSRIGGRISTVSVAHAGQSVTTEIFS